MDGGAGVGEGRARSARRALEAPVTRIVRVHRPRSIRTAPRVFTAGLQAVAARRAQDSDVTAEPRT
ncbi:hypothetical protein ABT187_32445 [Streptomyces sp. NPDC001817]|uniref:hypothetical protein n=1 Tax=Streptomyces sp. NPDC001817 TaxID=3154398 RepID=UPI003329AADC